MSPLRCPPLGPPKVRTSGSINRHLFGAVDKPDVSEDELNKWAAVSMASTGLMMYPPLTADYQPVDQAEFDSWYAKTAAAARKKGLATPDRNSLRPAKRSGCLTVSAAPFGHKSPGEKTYIQYIHPFLDTQAKSSQGSYGTFVIDGYVGDFICLSSDMVKSPRVTAAQLQDILGVNVRQHIHACSTTKAKERW